MKLYYREYFADDLRYVAVENAESVEAAVDALKEGLVESGKYWQHPVLAVINGGKA